MAGRDIIVIGASAGGVTALSQLVRGLPADFPGSILIVLHLPSSHKSHLPEILSRAGRLPAAHPAPPQKIEPGKIYVAPPNFHLLLEDGRIELWARP